jgi:YD repeat-containing protein
LKRLTEIGTYGIASPAPLRTNSFAYATNGIDLVCMTNALGVQVSSNSFNAYHQILTNFNALNEITTFTYNTNQQLTSVSRPTGLVTTNSYLASGDSVSRLSSSIDYAVVC